MSLPIPQWLRELVGVNKAALRSQTALAAQESINMGALHTVCNAAKCPNRGECFNCADATFMVLGDICTRGCRFCAVNKAKPLPPDENEPERIVQAIRQWGIRYAVLTMPTRDDLTDGGAGHFATVVKAISTHVPEVKTEPLVSDFKGSVDSLKTVLEAQPAVLAHNVETVAELYPAVRVGAEYKRTLSLLESSKKIAPHIFTKSGFMVGLGETETQIKTLLADLRNVGVDLITIGQYLAPSKQHYPVARYPEPSEYKAWEEYAYSVGFLGVSAGPLVRSSYRAGELYRKAVAATSKGN